MPEMLNGNYEHMDMATFYRQIRPKMEEYFNRGMREIRTWPTRRWSKPYCMEERHTWWIRNNCRAARK